MDIAKFLAILIYALQRAKIISALSEVVWISPNQSYTLTEGRENNNLRKKALFCFIIFILATVSRQDSIYLIDILQVVFEAVLGRKLAKI